MVSLTRPRRGLLRRAFEPDPEALLPSIDDLEALANAVREAARGRDHVPPEVEELPAETIEVGRRGHLRMLRTTESPVD